MTQWPFRLNPSLIGSINNAKVGLIITEYYFFYLFKAYNFHFSPVCRPEVSFESLNVSLPCLSFMYYVLWIC